MTDAIPGIGPAQAPAQTPPGGAQRIRPDVESFLTLLTAQISNQDPLAPMDSSTFVTQLAQLSQVEQSMEMGQRLETISAQLADVSTLSSLGLIGREVEVVGSVLREDGGNAFTYELGGAARHVTATVLDADGTALRTIEGLPGTAGRRLEVQWDGADDAGLPVMGGGPFTIAMAAEDEGGAPVEATTYVDARVEGVVRSDGASMLSLDNGTSVEAAAISRIR